MASSSRLIPHEHMLLEDGFAPNESTRSWAEAAGESTCPAYGSDPHWTCPTSIERWPCVYFRLLYKKIEDEATRREDEEENTRKQNKPNCTYESEGERERKRLAHISDTRLVQERRTGGCPRHAAHWFHTPKLVWPIHELSLAANNGCVSCLIFVKNVE